MAKPVQILVAEDSESDVFLLTKALEHTGLEFSLRAASDGVEAVEILTADPCPRFDLIVLDFHLPKASAIQILESIRAQGRHANSRIAILTSVLPEKTRSALTAAGAHAVLLKPSDLEGYDDLGLALRDLAQGRSSREFGTSAP